MTKEEYGIKTSWRPKREILAWTDLLAKYAGMNRNEFLEALIREKYEKVQKIAEDFRMASKVQKLADELKGVK